MTLIDLEKWYQLLQTLLSYRIVFETLQGRSRSRSLLFMGDFMLIYGKWCELVIIMNDSKKLFILYQIYAMNLGDVESWFRLL